MEKLIEKYEPLYPRLTKIAHFDEVDAKEVAFKAFKITYDRDSGYVGYKVNGDEFKTDCTKYDKIILVFKDGHYQVIELPEKLFVGPDIVYCGIYDRYRIMTTVYVNREAAYIKRFTFGGAIMNKIYYCIPEKSKIVFFEADTPEKIYIRYKPAPYQKINQQVCNPIEVPVKSAKARGNQVSIKEIAAVNSKPPRGWDDSAPTTQLKFA
ncbi:MAG: hypothetical protein ACP5K7_11470 [Verrucomicrobiia bacterium]